jgi:hypothetical protein
VALNCTPSAHLEGAVRAVQTPQLSIVVCLPYDPFRLRRHNIQGKDFVDSDLFKEVYYSKNGLVRIVQVLQVSTDSREWQSDPGNRACDAPGSWYCPGTYAPGLAALFDPTSTGEEAVLYKDRYSGRVADQAAGKAKPNGEGIPDGSYLGSCEGCSMTGLLLTCTHCRSRGVFEGSSIDMAKCHRDVNNVHGALSCAPEPNQLDIPHGHYTTSCLGCLLDTGGKGGADRVYCSHCRDCEGATRPAAYVLSRCPSPGMMTNDCGIIKCHNMENAQNIPAGGYAHSCEGCKLTTDGTVLSCSHCGTADGRQIETSLALAACPASQGSPDNSDGRLVCKPN